MYNRMTYTLVFRSILNHKYGDIANIVLEYLNTEWEEWEKDDPNYVHPKQKKDEINDEILSMLNEMNDELNKE